MLKALLERHGLRPQHRLGQNFLVDRGTLAKILAAVAPAEAPLILEIGPGPGILTAALAEAAPRVLAVEIDRGMVALLRETLGHLPNVEVIHGDALKVDLRSLLAERLQPGQKARVAANLPYYITSPLLFRLLEEDLPLDRIVVMVQREVALRMVAAPGSREYGALSVAVQYHTVPRVVARVSRGAFWPPPEVDSAVVALEVREQPAVSVPRRLFFAVVRAAFQQRRKTLANALAGGLGLERAWVEERVAAAGIDPSRRGETLSLEEFAAVARALGPAALDRGLADGDGGSWL
ncbi:MAG: 16S rRNA (adenine(1518)-N(6)/adenine(1519)-N(6))-dimethyltransferase RsmA [Bacillota bacterium]